MNNLCFCLQNNIPVSYTLDLEAVTAKYIEKHHTIISPNEGGPIELDPDPTTCSTIQRSAIYTLSGIASPLAGILGCMRNTVTCAPKAAFFDLVNGIKNLFLRSVATPICNCLLSPCYFRTCRNNHCVTGPHTLNLWLKKHRRFHSQVLTENYPVDLGFTSCYNCYPEINRKKRYNQQMNLIHRSYFKFTDYSNKYVIIEALQIAIKNNDQFTITFLELNHFFQNKEFFIEIAKWLTHMQSSPEIGVCTYLFLKSNPIFIYEFEASEELERKEFPELELSERMKLLDRYRLKPLKFSQFVKIYKYQEIRSLIQAFLKQQINIVEEIDKFQFPKVLKEIILEYSAPIGITEPKDFKNSYLPSYQNEDTPEVSQTMT